MCVPTWCARGAFRPLAGSVIPCTSQLHGRGLQGSWWAELVGSASPASFPVCVLLQIRDTQSRSQPPPAATTQGGGDSEGGGVGAGGPPQPQPPRCHIMNPGNVLQLPSQSAINAFATDLFGFRGFQAGVRACMRVWVWVGVGSRSCRTPPISPTPPGPASTPHCVRLSCLSPSTCANCALVCVAPAHLQHSRMLLDSAGSLGIQRVIMPVAKKGHWALAMLDTSRLMFDPHDAALFIIDSIFGYARVSRLRHAGHLFKHGCPGGLGAWCCVSQPCAGGGRVRTMQARVGAHRLPLLPLPLHTRHLHGPCLPSFLLCRGTSPRLYRTWSNLP